MAGNIIVVGAVSDDPLAIDIAHYMNQETEISDLLSYKTFANSEFCPRFIGDDNDNCDKIGHRLEGKTVVLVSSCSGELSRNARAMRTFLVARAAKENGAEKVILIEPDLFYSAQDRGARPELGKVAFQRTTADYKKFDGQPFSALLYCQLLKTSGVDAVMTVHNHSVSVQEVFNRLFDGQFYNLSPASIYANYLANHMNLNAADKQGLIICAPDKGAAPFARHVFEHLTKESEELNLDSRPSLLLMDKERTGERQVSIVAHKDSPTKLEELPGRTVVVFDDMVRTGGTIVECCRQLKDAGVARVIFFVTHFYSSQEVKENLNSGVINDIITTNTLPNILNRDMQGRLRHKMLVLKIERWIVNALRYQVLGKNYPLYNPPYTVDISRKNPNWANNQHLAGL